VHPPSVSWHMHFILKHHLNFGLQYIFKKPNILNNQNTIFICNKKNLSIKCKYSSVSHVSPNVKDGSPIHCIHFKPTKRVMHKSNKGLKVQPIAQVALDCILFGKSSLTNNYTWWNEYDFMSKLHKFRSICVPFQIATTYVPSFKYWIVPTLMSKCFHKFEEFSFTHITFFSGLKLQQYLFEPQFGIYDSVTIIARKIMRAGKFGSIEYWKVWETIIQSNEQLFAHKMHELYDLMYCFHNSAEDFL
jgi:hypothetical protein